MEIKLNINGLVSAPEAAKRLGVPRMSVHRWVKADRLLGINLDGLLYIPESELEKFQNERDAKSSQNE